MADPKNPKADPKAAAGDTKERKPRINPDLKIKLVKTENPKREGSEAHKRFALYRDGMTVKTFIEKGGTSADLRYDVDHDNIKLVA